MNLKKCHKTCDKKNKNKILSQKKCLAKDHFESYILLKDVNLQSHMAILSSQTKIYVCITPAIANRSALGQYR